MQVILIVWLRILVEYLRSGVEILTDPFAEGVLASNIWLRENRSENRQLVFHGRKTRNIKNLSIPSESYLQLLALRYGYNVQC